ncbi:MAG: hypothetical protein V7647_4233 [Acidobacteriota bacterium]|jgi:hypothetical protein
MRESDARTVAALRKWSVLLDSAFRVPGTNMTFGLDPLLGLIPWIGDITTPLFSAVLLLHAVRMRIPKVVQLRMLMNAAIDFAIGVIPVIGDLFDFGWKANVRNLALLERHAHPGSRAGASDWAFVLIVLGVLALLALAPILILGWLLAHIHL